MENFNLDDFLLQVEKPARYIGGEWNECKKQVTAETTRVAFCFPDVYEVGMSHLGMRILYDLINREENVYCERAFAPWVDMEKIIKDNNASVFTLETRTALNEFDILAFTLQYEMSFSNILTMLDLSSVPMLAKDRNNWDFPLVVAGGPSASNPEPLSEFIDLYLLGDGEESVPDLVRTYRQCRKNGKSKLEFLEIMAEKRGCYVPSFYDVSYKEMSEDNKTNFEPIYEDGKIVGGGGGSMDSFAPGFIEDDLAVNPLRKIASITPNNSHAKQIVESARIEKLEDAIFPTKCIVPNMGIVHDRITLEIMRGCTRGCRFCQAGYIYRPVRERSKETLEELAEEMVNNTGYEEISLSSLSSSDHSEINEITSGLIEKFEEKRVSVALPSLRLDNFNDELVESMPSVRKSGLTFAPEAGSQRLRDVINKNVTQQDLINTVRTAFSHGWHTLKLYFMIGLPTETMEDVQGIVDLADIVAEEYEKINGKKRGLTLTVSTSTFVPKPHTPFQWFGQENMESIYEKQRFLKKA